MTSAIEKLDQDVAIVAYMAAEMESYLNSDVLFWNMRRSGLPALTLGGYLMRQYRLLRLQKLLHDSKKKELDAAVQQYNDALVEKIIRFEQKAHRELDARLRQWGEYLKDVDRGTAASTSNYRNAVETRAMIAALTEQLQLAPYEIEPRVLSETSLLDRQLKRVWKPGEFIWFEEWQPAYPLEYYWWLYGNPREKTKK
ncbi:MAG: hypothetical protein R3293_01245 [Candidatus Promineifilaceae bacterium]|nr:hypothetical protein [Candidatus Promineifilaceae bacterium]